ncbi:DUF7572 family protein [Gordonia paraffinivorans]|uniref:DUF7572 family protein n=1 Tax=Gordonia paraffinivorans TaxID=175628 RepID=UPI003FCC7DF4
MPKAYLVAEALPWHAPVTNLYRTEDDTYYAVLVLDPVAMEQHRADWGIKVPVAVSHVPPTVSVYLSDENGRVIDYDGDPANGMTPILSTNPRSFAGMVVPDLVDAVNDPDRDPYAEALNILGYTLTTTE